MGSKVKQSIKRVQPEFQFGLEEIWSDASRLPRLTRSRIILHHFHSAWGSFLAAPLTSLVTIFTMCLALFLLAALILFRTNVMRYFDVPVESLRMRVFLYDTMSKEDRAVLQKKLEGFPGVASVRYVPKAEALEEFQMQLGEQASITDGLDEQNPLPASFEISADDPRQNLKVFPEIEQDFSSYQGVEYIQYRQALLQKLATFLQMLQRIGSFLILFALILTAGIITSTIRLAVYARRGEIEIMKLVGATDEFIRAPFLIEGFFQGFVGSLMSLVLLSLFYSGILDYLDRSGLIELAGGKISFLPLSWMFIILLVGSLVGLVGSYFAVRYFERGA